MEGTELERALADDAKRKKVEASMPDRRVTGDPTSLYGGTPTGPEAVTARYCKHCGRKLSSGESCPEHPEAEVSPVHPAQPSPTSQAGTELSPELQAKMLAGLETQQAALAKLVAAGLLKAAQDILAAGAVAISKGKGLDTATTLRNIEAIGKALGFAVEADRLGDRAVARTPAPDQHALDVAWGLLSNAHGGSWDNADPTWKKAAEAWRDSFYKRQP
jgi:hypothetical protein